MSIALHVEALRVIRGGRTLFDGLSFAARPGDFLEIRGPNGSGKTSLLRAVAGLLRPADGRVRFEGAAEPQTALHLLGHRDALKDALSVRAHARYWAALLGDGGDVEAALDDVGLAGVADLPVRALSQGQARRAALARLCVAARPIWLLDEPAAGLDAQGRDMLTRLIETHRATGGIVLAALHEALGVEGAQVELGG